MSPTVKSNCTPETICLLILRIAVVALITQKVDSLSATNPRLYYGQPESRHRERTRGMATREYEDESFSSDDLTKNSSLVFNNPEFHPAYQNSRLYDDKRLMKIKRPSNRNLPRYFSRLITPRIQTRISELSEDVSNDELLRKAIRGGVLLTPDEWESIKKPEVTGRQLDNEKYNARLIVYPENMKIPPRDTFIPKVKPECETSTICEEVESYPTEYVTEAVKNLKDLTSLAGTDVLYTIANRINLDDSDTPLCQSTETIWQPQSVRKDLNDNSSWHMVVNVDSYQQGFRVDKCLNPDGKCTQIDGVTGDLPSGWVASCKQQYIYRKIVVLSRSNGSAIVDNFPIPSSCCCHLKYDTASNIVRRGSET